MFVQAIGDLEDERKRQMGEKQRSGRQSMKLTHVTNMRLALRK